MSNDTIGRAIGVVEQNLSITNSREEKVQIRIKFDFSTATNNEIIGWAVSNRVIAFQRPARALSVDELHSLNNTTIIATEAGKKVKSREEKINDLVNAGLPMQLAVFAVDNPSKFNEVVDNLDTTTVDNNEVE
uniref:Uncharacterized protein n=1 Tax=viral metagenome TaxID=1070528 RepID=A0A6M3IJV2_9ZZZZ